MSGNNPWTFFLYCLPSFARLETLRRYARRRLGLDFVEPSKPSGKEDDEYAITSVTTAQQSTVASTARARATSFQRAKVTCPF